VTAYSGKSRTFTVYCVVRSMKEKEALKRQRRIIFPTVAVSLGIFFTAVVFNDFRAATHFATKFDLTNPFRKYLVIHMKCSCVCTMENHND